MAKKQRDSVPVSDEHIVESLRPLAVSIADLNEDPANLRKHSPKNVAAIRASLVRFGQRQPIVVRREGLSVIAGNARLAAARELGWPTIAAVLVDDDPTEAALYGIADNRTAELANWDHGALAQILSSLDAEDRLDVGWDDDDLSALVDSLGHAYSPNLNPEADGGSVTDADMEHAEGELDGATSSLGDVTTIEAVCPNCAHVFRVSGGGK